MRNSGRPLTRSMIIEHVWDIHFDSVSNVVEVHINSLRNKIDRGFDASAHPHHPRRRVTCSPTPCRHDPHAAHAPGADLDGGGRGAAGGPGLCLVPRAGGAPRRRRHGASRRADPRGSTATWSSSRGRRRCVSTRTTRDQAAFVHEATRYYQVYDAATGRLLVQSDGFRTAGGAADRRRGPGGGRTAGCRGPPDRLRPTADLEQRRFATGRAGPTCCRWGSRSRRRTGAARYRGPPAVGRAAVAPGRGAGLLVAVRARAGAAAGHGGLRRHDRRHGAPTSACPTRGAGDELDALAGAFNATLDRLEQLGRRDAPVQRARSRTNSARPWPPCGARSSWRCGGPVPNRGSRRSFASQIEEIDRLTRLIDHILTLARAESGRFP